MITRAVQGFTTATHTARIETDLGEGYLKAVGNPEGPHALACELVGSLAADWIGLKTFDFAIIQVTDTDEVSFNGKSWALPGPAFISRAEDMGFTWGGDAQTLAAIDEVSDLNGLLVVDTWLRNCDRRSPDGTRVNLKNVFLVQRTEPHRKLELIAMDFTHAFTCGHPVNRQLGFIEKIKDASIYCRFPEFERYLLPERIGIYTNRLKRFSDDIAKQFLTRVPEQWQLDGPSRSALRKFLVDRAQFTADTLEQRLWTHNTAFNFTGDTA